MVGKLDLMAGKLDLPKLSFSEGRLMTVSPLFIRPLRELNRI